jgi:hypothetical protein
MRWRKASGPKAGLSYSARLKALGRNYVSALDRPGKQRPFEAQDKQHRRTPNRYFRTSLGTGKVKGGKKIL